MWGGSAWQMVEGVLFFLLPHARGEVAEDNGYAVLALLNGAFRGTAVATEGVRLNLLILREIIVNCETPRDTARPNTVGMRWHKSRCHGKRTPSFTKAQQCPFTRKT